MRGKVHHGVSVHALKRITPAYAGKRGHKVRLQAAGRDHPRVCGEKRVRLAFICGIWGSPPRMRGKAGRCSPCACRLRITPAYAGKSKVPDDSKADDEGSPPRMRGKVLNVINGVRAKRITPAYAGKSVRPRLLQMPTWDHPRVCGEKALASGTTTIWWGSPPRMRGKVSDGEIAKGKVRITPAYAGKRHRAKKWTGQSGDHPRVCGEKRDFSRLPPFLQGSPPRMRGKVS